jgi:hypothetical protein
MKNDAQQASKAPTPSEHYRKLISGFCSLVGLEHNADAICSTGSLMCQDVAFTLLPVADQADTISVYVEFGEVPPERMQSVYRRLLEINLLAPLGHGPRLGVDCDSGKVIFAFQYSGLTAERLLACLELAAQQAQQWRSTFFLDQESVNDPWHALAPGSLRA